MLPVICPHCCAAIDGGVWLLFLNDMRSAHVENLRPVARASSREKLLALVERERVEPYREATGMPAESPNTNPTDWATQVNPTRWHKVFRSGGPLEWCNPPDGPPADHCRRVERFVDFSSEIDGLFDAEAP
jgi:hypothetical protein